MVTTMPLELARKATLLQVAVAGESNLRPTDTALDIVQLADEIIDLAQSIRRVELQRR